LKGTARECGCQGYKEGVGRERGSIEAKGGGCAVTYRATLHQHWTWRVADSFSCLMSVDLISIGGPNASVSCSMPALTLVAEG